jgi:GntR family transcriptional regulator / MocR family aminotransferase
VDWTVTLAPDADPEQPVFVRIARAVAEAIRAGRLRPGQRLPGSRTLAAELEVHRNTVLAAFDELAAEGWIEARHGRGTFVRTALPDARERAAAGATGIAPATCAFPLAAPAPAPEPDDWPAVRPGAIDLSRGTPDVRLVPGALIARALRRNLRRHPELLDYGDPRGHERLRTALADMLRTTRGLPIDHTGVVVTRGSQMALYLAARAILRPGDHVAVEALGYRAAWQTLRAAGARLVPVPVDAAGLDVDRLAAACARRRIRAVYLTPHHQYPTTAVLDPARRLALLDLARRRRFAVLEDDYDNEFHYRGRPVLPLASADPAGSVVYLGSLSKVLAPSLRIGYLVAPPPLLDRIADLRRAIDGQGDSALERALADLFEDGDIQRHARRMRRIYQARRAVLAEALRRRLGDVAEVTLPPGGMALWVAIDPALDLEAWAARCLERGVRVVTARHFAFDRRVRPFIRLGFAAPTEAELRRGVARMAAAL